MVDHGFLKNLFEIRTLGQLTSAISLAYSIADSAYDKVDFLATISGKDLIPILRNKSLESVLLSRCKSGNLPFDAEFSRNSRNHHFLLMKSDRVFMTVSQVKKCDAFPREANFRNNAAQDGQQTLDGFSEDRFENELPLDSMYAILTHGCDRNFLGGQPQFANLGIPDANCRMWLANMSLPLMNIVPLEGTDKISQITEEAIDLTLKVIEKENDIE